MDPKIELEMLFANLPKGRNQTRRQDPDPVVERNSRIEAANREGKALEAYEQARYGFSWLTETERVEKTMLQMLEKRKAVDSLSVASALRWAPRGLAYRLRNEGTNFLKVRESAIQKYAKQELGRGYSCSVNKIAQTCGFAYQSNFSRAFKTWTGISPHEYISRSRLWGSDESKWPSQFHTTSK